MLIPILKASLRPVIAQYINANASPEQPQEPIGSANFWWKMVVSLGLVLLGGVFAG